MTKTQIVKELYRLQDKEYGIFQAKLIPTVEPEKIIGVRTPDLRAFAKELAGKKETEDFLASLPHTYFDEDQLHAFIISREKDFDRCMQQVEAFLPYINNWATCDQLSPTVFKKQPDKLLEHILK